MNSSTTVFVQYCIDFLPNADGTCSVPLMTYKVMVYTGDRTGAGTDANVFITLFGEN